MIICFFVVLIFILSRRRYPLQLDKRGDPGNANAVADLLSQDVTYWTTTATYNQYTFMVHYCDMYFANKDFPDGRPVWCANDPLSHADRMAFCAEFTPQYVFAGLVLSTLSLEDVCPFLNTAVPNRAAYPYCLVFSDHPKSVCPPSRNTLLPFIFSPLLPSCNAFSSAHSAILIPSCTPRYSTVGALLQNKLPDGNTWNGKKFYYVPFKLAILRNIMTYASVADVLISNHADASTFTRLTSANFERYGPAGLMLFSHLMAAIGGSKTRSETLDRICDGTNPMTPSAMSIVYDIIQLAETDSGTYTFLSFESVNPRPFSTTRGAHSPNPVSPRCRWRRRRLRV